MTEKTPAPRWAARIPTAALENIVWWECDKREASAWAGAGYSPALARDMARRLLYLEARAAEFEREMALGDSQQPLDYIATQRQRAVAEALAPIRACGVTAEMLETVSCYVESLPRGDLPDDIDVRLDALAAALEKTAKSAGSFPDGQGCG